MENKALMSRLVVTNELCNKCAVQQNTQEVSANKYYKVMDDLEMKNNHGDAHVTHRNWLFYGNDMANGTLFRFMQ